MLPPLAARLVLSGRSPARLAVRQVRLECRWRHDVGGPDLHGFDPARPDLVRERGDSQAAPIGSLAERQQLGGQSSKPCSALRPTTFRGGWPVGAWLGARCTV